MSVVPARTRPGRTPRPDPDPSLPAPSRPARTPTRGGGRPQPRPRRRRRPDPQARSVEHPDRAYLDTAERCGHVPGNRQGLVQIGRLDQVEAAQRFLGLRERAISDGGGTGVPAADRRGRCLRLQRRATSQRVAVPLTKCPVLGEYLGGLLVTCLGPGLLVLVAQDKMLPHGSFPSVWPVYRAFTRSDERASAESTARLRLAAAQDPRCWAPRKACRKCGRW